MANRAERLTSGETERGAILVMTALVMMLLLFIAAFATDLGAWYRQGQEQQRAADVAALNGMQSYDRGYKAYFDSLTPPAQQWSDLSFAQSVEAERAGMISAVNTVIGLLETSGKTFSQSPVEVQLTPPPNVPGDESVYTITADDGTLVTIARRVETLPDGRTSSSMSIALAADGDQYFSNILRDAPQIQRESTAVLSNCGAECTRSIVINPPFAGFDAAGSGDGYKPLLYGDTEIWAVNHHIQADWLGDIICMDRDTTSSCGSFSLGPANDTAGYNTATRPVELLSNAVNKIYIPSTRRTDNRAGLACFDVARRQFCTTPFIDFWDSANTWSSPAVGVWEYAGNAYVLSHHGEIACVTTSADASGGMQSCGEANTAIVGHSRAWTEGASPNRVAWGEIIGNDLYLISRGQNNDALFHCFQMDTQTPCWGGAVVNPGSNYRRGEAIGFIRHATNGAREGVCLAVPQQSDRHYCVNFNGSALSALPNFAAAMVPLGESWAGGAFTWNNEKTFFTGGNADTLTCYSWIDRDYCGQVDLDAIRPGNYEVRTSGPRTGSEEIEPYALTEVTPLCLVGLGDQSYFFSFSPETLDPCVDTRLNTEIFPCECADGGNKWGEVRMPAELIAKVDTLFATVSYTENGPPINATLNRADLLANGGILELAGVDPTYNVLYLLLEVEAKLGPDGKPVWQSPITADLQIVVQPTLAG